MCYTCEGGPGGGSSHLVSFIGEPDAIPTATCEGRIGQVLHSGRALRLHIKTIPLWKLVLPLSEFDICLELSAGIQEGCPVCSPVFTAMCVTSMKCNLPVYMFTSLLPTLSSCAVV